MPHVTPSLPPTPNSVGCLDIPGRAYMLGRGVLPAHRDWTAYTDQIDALQAA